MIKFYLFSNQGPQGQNTFNNHDYIKFTITEQYITLYVDKLTCEIILFLFTGKPLHTTKNERS